MKHEIDLKNYNIHSDLIIENINENIKNIDKKIYKLGDIIVTRIKLDKENGNLINKDMGNYITIEFNDITDSSNNNDVKNLFIKELSYILNINGLKDNSKILVVGLGNINSTPDSLGPLTVSNVMVTGHLFTLGIDVDKRIKNVSLFKPSVMADTGMETSSTIKAIVKDSNPDIVIIIDALAASSISKINKSIQITDTGINPGGGVCNNREAINKKFLGKPVVCIGIPTVVSSSVIVYDTINYIFKHIANLKNNLNKSSDLNKDEKRELLGLFGELSSSEKKSLINETLSFFNYNLIVTPKEIDFQINKLSKLLGDGINKCLHKVDVKM